MTEHTPGPWAYTERDRPGRKITLKRRHWEVGSLAPEAGRAGVAIVFGDDRANARLTAAAPDLLAALKSLCGWCEALDADESVFIAEAIERARVAIAKATGQPSPEPAS